MSHAALIDIISLETEPLTLMLKTCYMTLDRWSVRTIVNFVMFIAGRFLSFDINVAIVPRSCLKHGGYVGGRDIAFCICLLRVQSLDDAERESRPRSLGAFFPI